MMSILCRRGVVAPNLRCRNLPGSSLEKASAALCLFLAARARHRCAVAETDTCRISISEYRFALRLHKACDYLQALGENDERCSAERVAEKAREPNACTTRPLKVSIQYLVWSCTQKARLYLAATATFSHGSSAKLGLTASQQGFSHITRDKVASTGAARFRLAGNAKRTAIACSKLKPRC